MADESNALVPVQQQTVEFYGDEIPAALIDVSGQEQVYVPLRPICEYLGVDWSSQVKRLRRDPVLLEVLRPVVITTTGRGERSPLCLPLDYLNGWLFGISVLRVKDEIRHKLVRYQRECYRVLARAFQAEVLPRATTATADLAVLAQVRETALAVAQLAEQQILFQQQTMARLDRAAEAFKALDRRVSVLEGRALPAATIGDEQAAEISIQVKALAELLTANDPSKNHYQSVFAELYRRFGVSSYKLIRQDQVQAVLEFLEDWRRSAS